MMVDEGFLLVAAHIDSATRDKITKGQYVRFSKLLSHDRGDMDEDQRMEMVNKDGRPVWVPVADKDFMAITSFGKWEQAFRVYSDIYLKVNPSRAQELIQYNHIIYTASLTFHWDNVYKYDRLFRLHMEQNPRRSWGVILQQAWSLCLKDKLIGSKGTPEIIKNENRVKKGKPCYKFNKGKCTYGLSCKFEHKCMACSKFGHGVHNCRKMPAIKEKGNQGRINNFMLVLL